MKLTMKKGDVEHAIGQYVRNNYQNLNVKGRDKPETIHHVLATIQDREYMGAGKYNVVLDIYGAVTDELGNIKENEHYKTECMFVVATDTEGSPVPELCDDLILTKQRI